MRSLKRPLLLGSLAAASLIVRGWLCSDARALQQLRRREHLNSPEAVFRWVTRHYRQALATDPVLPGASLQSQLQRPSQRLWCDEGAILIGLLNQQLGRHTHLVDPLDARAGIPLASTVTRQAMPRYRDYPANAVQQFLLHNALDRGAVSQWQQQRSQAHRP